MNNPKTFCSVYFRQESGRWTLWFFGNREKPQQNTVLIAVSMQANSSGVGPWQSQVRKVRPVLILMKHKNSYSMYTPLLKYVPKLHVFLNLTALKLCNVYVMNNYTTKQFLTLPISYNSILGEILKQSLSNTIVCFK